MNKVGIITIPRANNYGSVLQAYAIQQFIQELEMDSEFIDYLSPFLIKRYNLWDFRKGDLLKSSKSLIRNILIYKAKKKKLLKFEEFRRLLIFSNKMIYSQEEIKFHAYKKIVIGSDQIWNTRITGFDKAFFLDFIKNREYKVAFSASMGYTDRNEEEIAFYKEMLSSFKWIAVREKNDVEFIKNIASRDSVVEYIIDPTLLIPEERWRSFIKSRLIKEKYILVYLFGDNYNVIRCAKLIAEQKQLPVYIIADEWRKKNKYGFINLPGIGPIDFINLVANAEHIITNSFAWIMKALNSGRNINFLDFIVL